jgi:type IV secretory pathway VirB9-like protein
MKRYLLLILIVYFVCAHPVRAQQKSTMADAVIPVATALNHLTVLEFHEPVTMAAAGSSDFQIERQEDKVFIKPTKPGASTDLFVWTASRRFAYELATTPEVKNMNVSIDNPLPAAAASPATGVDPRVEEFADMMLTRAFLGTVEIASANPRTKQGRVCVRVQRVFRTRTSVYVHYVVENNSKSAYRLVTPGAREIKAGHANLALPSFAHKQLDPRLLANLSNVSNVSLPVAYGESATEDLAPGESTHGVLAIRQDLDSPAVIELVFEGGITATFVL